MLYLEEVSCGSTAEVGNHVCDVRFALISGSRDTPVALPLCAISGSWWRGACEFVSCQLQTFCFIEVSAFVSLAAQLVLPLANGLCPTVCWEANEAGRTVDPIITR